MCLLKIYGPQLFLLDSSSLYCDMLLLSLIIVVGMSNVALLLVHMYWMRQTYWSHCSLPRTMKYNASRSAVGINSVVDQEIITTTDQPMSNQLVATADESAQQHELFKLFYTLRYGVSSIRHWESLHGYGGIALGYLSILHWHGCEYCACSSSMADRFALEYMLHYLTTPDSSWTACDMYTCHVLGYLHEHGIGIQRNLTRALQLYHRSEAGGHHMIALFRLSSLYEKGVAVEQNGGTAFEYLSLSAEQGHGPAQSDLGYFYDHGIGVRMNSTVAVHYYRLAAMQGNSEAQYNLGLSYFHGTGVDKDVAVAVQYFRSAADQGDAEARNNLAYCLEEGIGVDRDAGQAFKYYSLAAEQGNVKAIFNLGLCYDEGVGVAKNERRAFGYYKLAARGGNQKAQYNVGIHYSRGIAVKKSVVKALRFFLLALEQQFTPAQVRIGSYYQSGVVLPRNSSEAGRLYQLAADKGDADGQFHLAVHHHLSGDAVEAAKYYSLAAIQNHFGARNNLGVCYLYGTGVSVNVTEGVRHIEDAAVGGDPDAQYNLGRCYHYGIGRQASIVTAVRYYRLAAIQGKAAAKAIVEENCREEDDDEEGGINTIAVM